MYHALNFGIGYEDTKHLIKGDSMDFREILKLQFDEYESETEFSGIPINRSLEIFAKEGLLIRSDANNENIAKTSLP